jgi:hypothetical protein
MFGVFLGIFSCQPETDQSSYKTIDYLTVRKKLDTLNVDMNKNGYRPTVTVLKNGRKRLTFFGASHIRNTDAPQFRALEQAFLTQQPQIAFNEGGYIAKSKQYTSSERAIKSDGERGLLKYLCDRQHIAMLNGDMTTKDEFTALLNRFPKDQVYLYMAVERFLNPYRQGYIKGLSFEKAFQQEHVAYLEQNGFTLTAQEKTTTYLKSLYATYFHRALDLGNLVEVHDYYLTDPGIFGQIGRASKEVRDQALLVKIDKSLDDYDRVFVVFGGSHWVAVQPGLQYIIDKPRKKH